MRPPPRAIGDLEKARWLRVREVYHSVLDCADPERGTLLDEACRGDQSLRREVESLLESDSRASSFLVAPPPSRVEPALRAANEAPLIGRRMGAYVLGSVLGRGGMGVVYEAEQENPRRTVALKLLRAAPFFDEYALRLFHRETQALARLNHPGIAAIYEAGQTEDGWCYFAMERVDGVPLHRFVRERRLARRERLDIFLRLCAAVQYAHQRGVIHRDLKPSNILLTVDGQPKILDFGLARISDPEGDASQITRPGTFQGTLAYVSPEQASGRTDEVDARSDVYSLGVILHELLAGAPPYEVAGLDLAAAVRVICESPPRPLGTADCGLQGDLETITRKALEKQPALRYSSVVALADDIERFLRKEPILAQPHSTIYQLRMLLERHRAASAVAATFLVLVLCFAATTAWLAARATKQRDLAQAAGTEATEARDSAEQFASFLEGLFERANPAVETTKDPSLRQILDEAYTRLGKVENPLVRARLMTVLGKVYADLNDFPKARELLDSALSIRRSRLGPRHPDLAETIAADARLRTWRHEPGADAAARELIEIRRRQFGDDHRRVAEAWSLLGDGYFYTQDLAQAERAFRAALEMRRRIGDVKSSEYAGALFDLGSALTNMNRLDEAEPLLRESLALRQELGDLPAILAAMEGLAQLLWRQDKLESEKIYAEELALARKCYPPTHAKLGWILRNYAYTVRHNRSPTEAEPLQREALEITRATYGTHWEVGQCLQHLAITLLQLKRGDEARELLREECEMYRKLFGPDDERTVKAIELLQESEAEKG